MAKTFIVTGGNGYIGSHMCKYLCNQGAAVLVFDNNSTSPKEPTHSYGEFHHLDIVDSEKIREILVGKEVEAIFHFAAKAIVSESQANPLFYYQENFSKTLELLKTSIDLKIKHFIFSSTCATFGIPTTDRISEENLQEPINSYGLSKLMTEKAMRDLCNKELINIACLRYFNAAGCSPEGEIGENHQPETHLIPILCQRYLAGQEEMIIYGDDFETDDGTCIRDYIHVDDLAKAHYQSYLRIKEHKGFHDYNLGSEQGYSVKEVIDTLSELTSKEFKYKVEKRRIGDPPKLVADSSKAKTELGFQAQYNLKDSLSHTLNYLEKKDEFL